MKEFEGQIKKTIRIYKPDILFFMETNVNSSRARTIIRKLYFYHYKEISPIGLIGGIWMVWNGDRCLIKSCKEDDRYIHFAC